MDLSGIAIQDAAPLMEGLERALAKPEIEVVELRDCAEDAKPVRFSRLQAQVLLARLEKKFFATIH